MEAQSQSLACVATAVSGIPELIVNGETGLLVEARDVGAMTATLDRLIADPVERERLGRAGTERLHADFSSERGIDAITGGLRDSLCAATAAKEVR